jgi:hypothetical protein
MVYSTLECPSIASPYAQHVETCTIFPTNVCRVACKVLVFYMDLKVLLLLFVQ